VTDGTFVQFLIRSLELLRRESPSAYLSVCRKLGARCVAISVGGEQAVVRSVRDRLEVVGGAPDVSARASAGWDVLKKLLDGERGLTEAIFADEILLEGPLDDLVAFYEGLLAYFQGAVRSPGFPLLLDELFGTLEGRPERERRRSAR
jgi:hypothetical protein